MLDMKLCQGLAIMLSVVGFGFSAPEAFAGGCNSGYSSHGHHGRSVSVGYHGPNFSFHIGSHRSYHGHYRHRSYSYCDTPRIRYSSHRTTYHTTYQRSSYRSYDTVYHAPRHTSVVVHQPAPKPCGYWKQVWIAPQYDTRYDCHGHPYRVQVSAGYYDRVWVE